MMTLEDYRKCKKASKELTEAIKNRVSEICGAYDEENMLEDEFRFDFSGTEYCLTCLGDDDWEDGGKYQYSSTTYQVVSLDKDDTVTYYDIVIELPITRSGSYFSYYTYSYAYPIIRRAKIKHIAEVIIPAHDEVVCEEV